MDRFTRYGGAISVAFIQGEKVFRRTFVISMFSMISSLASAGEFNLVGEFFNDQRISIKPKSTVYLVNKNDKKEPIIVTDDGTFDHEIKKQFLVGQRFKIVWFINNGEKQFKQISLQQIMDKERFEIVLEEFRLYSGKVLLITKRGNRRIYLGNLPAATVKIVSALSSTRSVIASTVTDSSGKFEMKIPMQRTSEWEIKIDHIRCQNDSVKFDISNSLLEVELKEELFLEPVVFEAQPKSIVLKDRRETISLTSYKKNIASAPTDISLPWTIKQNIPDWLHVDSLQGYATLEGSEINLTYSKTPSTNEISVKKSTQLTFVAENKGLIEVVRVYAGWEPDKFSITGIITFNQAVPQNLLGLLVEINGKNGIFREKAILESTGSFRIKIPNIFDNENATLTLESQIFSIDEENRLIDLKTREAAPYIVEVSLLLGNNYE